MAIRITLLTSIIPTLIFKAEGMGFPIVKDDIRFYRDINTTISEDGNIENEILNETYNDELPDKEFFSYLYNYSDWEKITSEAYTSDSYIRYVEIYDLEERAVEEIAELLKQENIDLKNILEEPIDVYTEINPSKEVLQEGAYKEAQKFDRYCFVEKEPTKINVACTLLWLGGSVLFGEIFYFAWRNNLGNPVRLQKIIEEKNKKRKEKWEKELQEASLKLKRKR